MPTVPTWGNKMLKEAWEEARQRVESESGPYSAYRQDPVGFCERIMGAKFTDDVKTMMESVIQYPVTVGRSGNGVGKSFAAAHFALFWFLVYPESKVFITAAPPLENLMNILWGELTGRMYARRRSTGFINPPNSGSATRQNPPSPSSPSPG